MKKTKYATAALSVIASVGAAHAATLVHNSTVLGAYEGSADPTGFTNGIGAGSITHDSPSAGIGTLVIAGGTGDNRFITTAANDLGNDWTVETRLKLNSNTDSGFFQLQAAGDDASGGYVRLVFNDNGTNMTITASTTSNFGEDVTVGSLASFEGDGQFHTIRVAHDASLGSDNTTIWVDDVELGKFHRTITMDDAGVGGDAIAIWGDSSSGIDDGTVEIDYVRYNTSFVAVPEPSSAALLGLGGLALILRRRK